MFHSFSLAEWALNTLVLKCRRKSCPFGVVVSCLVLEGRDIHELGETPDPVPLLGLGDMALLDSLDDVDFFTHRPLLNRGVRACLRRRCRSMFWIPCTITRCENSS